MNDKSFSIYDGNTIKKFTESCKELYEFFDNKLPSNTHVDAVKNSLLLWPEIYNFLVKCRVDENYMDEVNQYDANMEKLYEYGRDSFLTLHNGSGKKGDGETSYFHVLRCYIPVLAKDTF